MTVPQRFYTHGLRSDGGASRLPQRSRFVPPPSWHILTCAHGQANPHAAWMAKLARPLMCAPGCADTAAQLRLSIWCPVPPSADIHGFDYAADAALRCAGALTHDISSRRWISRSWKSSKGSRGK